MIPNAYWLDDYPAPPTDWVVEGLVCPYITVLSGQPKVRKSTLAAHIALAVINNTPFLGKAINTKFNKVAWIGFDPGWHNELRTRCGDNAKNSILLQPGFTSLSLNDWTQLGELLLNQQIGLLVVDHLYGYADLQLNDSNEAKKVFNALNIINERYGIPIILIAHSPKGFGSASAAHSNIIKSSARVLLELKGEAKSGARTLTVIGNEIEGEKLSIRIDQSFTEFLSKIDETQSRQDRDFKGNLERAKRFFAEATPEELLSIPKAAPVLIRLKVSKNLGSSKKMLHRWQDKKLIEITEAGITPGDNYFT